MVFCFTVQVANTKKRSKRESKPEKSHVPIVQRPYGSGNIDIEGKVVDNVDEEGHFQVTGSTAEGVSIQHLSNQAGFVLSERNGYDEVYKDGTFILCGGDQYYMASDRSFVHIVDHAGTVSRIGEDDTDEEVVVEEDDDDEGNKIANAEFIDPKDIEPDMAINIANIASSLVTVVPMSLRNAAEIKKEVENDPGFVLPAMKPLTKKQKKTQEENDARLKELEYISKLRKEDASIHLPAVNTAMKDTIIELEEIAKMTDEQFYTKNPYCRVHKLANGGFKK